MWYHLTNTVLFKCHAFAGLENQINEFVTALRDANLGEEKEKKIGMELKSLMDKAAAARSKAASNKAEVTFVPDNWFSQVLKLKRLPLPSAQCRGLILLGQLRAILK